MSEPTQHQADVSFRWQWNWKVLLFTAIFLPITVSLALWQLDRADEKKLLLDMYHQRGIAEPVVLGAVLDQSGSEYLRVRVTGTYDNRSPLLLDNRVRRGRPGYEVISLFKASTGQWILVNRGWIMGNSDRTVLPEIDAIDGEVALTGYLYRSPGKQLMLGEDNWQVEVGPKIIQNAAPEVVAEKIKLPLFSYTLRLDADAQGVLEAGWALVSVQPGKHTGYAVQWTVLALVLMVLTLFANSNLGDVISTRRRMNREKISDQ